MLYQYNHVFMQEEALYLSLTDISMYSDIAGCHYPYLQ